MRVTFAPDVRVPELVSRHAGLDVGGSTLADAWHRTVRVAFERRDAAGFTAIPESYAGAAATATSQGQRLLHGLLEWTASHDQAVADRGPQPLPRCPSGHRRPPRRQAAAGAPLLHMYAKPPVEHTPAAVLDGLRSSPLPQFRGGLYRLTRAG